MRIFCSICKEIFIPYSEINSTSCGHLYHSSCISRWLKQHKTCPQCRSEVRLKLIRIYFDVDKDTEEDASTLEHKLENLTSELRQSESTIKVLREKNDKSEEILTALEESTKELKTKNNILKSSVRALKDQINKLNKQHEEFSKMKTDLEALKKKLLSYKSLDLIMKCGTDEAEKILRETPPTELGVRQLAIFTSALKDKTEQDRKKIDTLIYEKKELQKALDVEQQKSKNLDPEYNKLKAEFNTLKKELSIAKDLLKQNSQKVSSRDFSDDLTKSKSQVSLKRPLFHINFDPVDCKVEKISKKSKICDLSENLKHWEELVSAGPSTHMGFLCSKTKLKSKTSTRVPQEKLQERTKVNYTFDGMGGSQKICLAQPTPKEEFHKLKQNIKQKKKI
ncbi:hypothetical protein RUM43_002768 [Polyplax serrata]|uniref:RING-type domain-containing protein n=1 Tax=Polyplax serrata TaxID=468196 RepID=A0AAN8NZK5_POLSC